MASPPFSFQRTADVNGLSSLRDRLSAARRVLVLTGAGISVGSGLATFRGAGGLYTDSELESFHDAANLPGSLPGLWSFWGPFRAQVQTARPSPAHEAIAAWQVRSSVERREVTLVTQNVDDLHARASSPHVHHLHGRLMRSRCLDPVCGYTAFDPDTHDGGVPPCPTCAGPMRPDIVLFGEPVDLDAQWAAKRAVRDCDAFVAVGTSGTVMPAAGLLRYASDVGALTVCVDPGEADPMFDHHVALPADEALPALLGS